MKPHTDQWVPALNNDERILSYVSNRVSTSRFGMNGRPGGRAGLMRVLLVRSLALCNV